jgi:hypothetical protein
MNMKQKIDLARSASSDEQTEQDAYDVFGFDEKGRPPLLGKYLDEREAEELARAATKH